MKAKEKLPKTCRFHKVKGGERYSLYVQSGLVSNRHWMFKASWLEKLNPPRSLGFQALKNSVNKAQTQATIARLEDRYYPSADLEGVYKTFQDAIPEYREAKDYRFFSGYVRGKPFEKDAAVIHFRGKYSPYLDVAYGAAVFFDPECIVMIRDKVSPILILDSEKNLVGIIMQLRAADIERHRRSKK